MVCSKVIRCIQLYEYAATKNSGRRKTSVFSKWSSWMENSRMVPVVVDIDVSGNFSATKRSISKYIVISIDINDVIKLKLSQRYHIITT